MNNMQIWNAVKQPPATAIKPINAGRLKGKSDINPQWRIQAMTEQFGPCGTGWKYSIDRLWTEPGSDGQVVAFAQIALSYCTDGKWSEPIPGIGGNMLIEQERNGAHTSDEAYKMAVTDALSVAMKALGVAADIYAGLWDGSKYRNGNGEPEASITGEQAAELAALISEVNADAAKFSSFFGISKLGELPVGKFKQAVAMLEAKRATL